MPTIYLSLFCLFVKCVILKIWEQGDGGRVSNHNQTSWSVKRRSEWRLGGFWGQSAEHPHTLLRVCGCGLIGAGWNLSWALSDNEQCGLKRGSGVGEQIGVCEERKFSPLHSAHFLWPQLYTKITMDGERTVKLTDKQTASSSFICFMARGNSG